EIVHALAMPRPEPVDDVSSREHQESADEEPEREAEENDTRHPEQSVRVGAQRDAGLERGRDEGVVPDERQATRERRGDTESRRHDLGSAAGETAILRIRAPDIRTSLLHGSSGALRPRDTQASHLIRRPAWSGDGSPAMVCPPSLPLSSCPGPRDSCSSIASSPPGEPPWQAALAAGREGLSTRGPPVGYNSIWSGC